MKRKLLLSMMLMFLLVSSAWAQRTITGTVTSEEGALPGATVQIKGTTQGTQTDMEGKYTLTVPQGSDVLVFRYVGFVVKEETIGSRTVIDVVLKEDILESVIVTGYQEIIPQEFTGSATVIDEASIEQVPIASFDQILQGQSPGLIISGGNGQPGAAASVRIRGTGSINGANDPLYMLDGVPIEAGTFATLNPNDFASVTVLKDASATAIYGSRGSNGVIVITTKKGKSGETLFNYRTQYGWSDFTLLDNFKMLNTEQKIQRELETGQGLAPNLSEEELAELRLRDTNWRDELFRTGITKSHELNASGGNENTTFYVSANYFTQEGITLDSELDRYTLRFNLNSKQRNFSFGTNTSLGYSQELRLRNTGLSTANPFLAAFLLNPYDQLKDPETGEYLNPSQGTNTFALLEQSRRQRDEYKIVSNANLAYAVPFVKGLSISTNWGIDLRMRNFEAIDEPNSFIGFGPNQQGSLTRSFNRRVRFIGTNSISYKKEINEDHSISVGLFHEINYENFKNESFTGYGLNRILEPNGVTPGTGSNGFIPVIDGERKDNSLLSYFANLNYSFKDRYFLNATIRRDGSSRFGANNRIAYFYALGGSWSIIDEEFMNKFDMFDNLKFRVSYGTTGNQFVGGEDAQNFYPSRATFDPTVSYNGQSGTIVSSAGNPNLKWEVNNQFNTGLDFSIFNRRISGSIDYYHQKTSDLFIPQQLSRTTGFLEVDLNQGEVVNQGIEVGIKGDVVRTKDLTWSLNANFTYNKNRVTSLGQVDQFENGTSIIRVGLPLGSHYVVGYAGVDPENGAPIYLDSLGNSTPVFSAANSTANWGTNEAPYFGGFGTNLSYKGFTINALFVYFLEQYTFNNNQFFLENPNFAGFNQHENVLDTWKQPGDITNIPAITYPTQISSSRFIQNNSFLRLRNVTISYNIPEKILARTKYIRSVRAFVQAQNALTFANKEYTGFDPEPINNIVQGNYPTPRTITIGIDLGL